ncbi:hypothetical protein NSQ54_01265 [Alkalihalobacillus sp. FSL W8-0930]
MAENNQGRKMSYEEAGRKGGEKTKNKHGKKHFSEIGKNDHNNSN